MAVADTVGAAANGDSVDAEMGEREVVTPEMMASEASNAWATVQGATRAKYVKLASEALER